MKNNIFILMTLFLLTSPARADEYQTCLDAAEGVQAETDCMMTEADRLNAEITTAYDAMLGRAIDQDQLEKETPSGDPKDFTNVLSCKNRRSFTKPTKRMNATAAAPYSATAPAWGWSTRAASLNFVHNASNS